MVIDRIKENFSFFIVKEILIWIVFVYKNFIELLLGWI